MRASWFDGRAVALSEAGAALLLFVGWLAIVVVVLVILVGNRH